MWNKRDELNSLKRNTSTEMTTFNWICRTYQSSGAVDFDVYFFVTSARSWARRVWRKWLRHLHEFKEEQIKMITRNFDHLFHRSPCCFLLRLAWTFLRPASSPHVHASRSIGTVLVQK